MARIIEKQVSSFKISFPSEYETFRLTFLKGNYEGQRRALY
jgi:hypothetical protein